jgi:hypothetical protein
VLLGALSQMRIPRYFAPLFSRHCQTAPLYTSPIETAYYVSSLPFLDALFYHAENLGLGTPDARHIH